MSTYKPPSTPEELDYLREHGNEPWTDENGEVFLADWFKEARPLTNFEMWAWWNSVRENNERRDLLFALKSRVLTDEEMSKVASLGVEIYRRILLPYKPCVGPFESERDLNERLNSDLLQQFRLRHIAAKVA